MASQNIHFSSWDIVYIHIFVLYVQIHVGVIFLDKPPSKIIYTHIIKFEITLCSEWYYVVARNFNILMQVYGLSGIYSQSFVMGIYCVTISNILISLLKFTCGHLFCVARFI
jgi:hypothetical protein